MYHFLSGYTAKVAGTEKGLGKEPQATFSTCFGAPFMVHHPAVYANMLKEKISRHKTTCWLVNTGWSGGPFGIGNRIKIAYTRAMISAALEGTLASAPTTEDPVFGLHIPMRVNGAPDDILQPRNTWSDKHAYDEKAKDLAGRFHENFKQFADKAADEVRAASPKVV
jgi:phosphoenolpyruvate carboxykinase (ATP)